MILNNERKAEISFGLNESLHNVTESMNIKQNKKTLKENKNFKQNETQKSNPKSKFVITFNKI